MIKKVTWTRGAIGYVDLGFVRHSGLGYGRIGNAAGRFVRATPASIAAACTALKGSLPDDFRLDVINAPGKDSYPMASFTWLYVPISGSTSARTSALKQFLNWFSRKVRRLQGLWDMLRCLGPSRQKHGPQ